MGKHIKTRLDYEMIEALAKEVKKLDPKIRACEAFAMENFEGSN